MADAELDAIRAKVKRGFLAIMQRKIDLSPELDLVTPDQDGNTLLHLAVVHNKLAILTYLLSLPAFQTQPVLQATNAEGLTALQMARAHADGQPLAELLHTVAGGEVAVQQAGEGDAASGGSDGSGDDAAERLTELKSKLTTPPPPAVVVPQSAVPKPGFWGGLFGLTIPPAAPDAGGATTAEEEPEPRERQQTHEAVEETTAAAAAETAVSATTEPTRVQTKLVLAQAAGGWWSRGGGGGGGGGELVTITRVEFGELEKAQAQQLGLVERLTAQVEEQALKLDRAKVKVETAERLAAKQEAALKALTSGGPSTVKDVHRLTAQVEELKMTVADKSKALASAQKAAAAAAGGSQRGGGHGDVGGGGASELSAENESLRLDVAYLRAKLVDQTKAGDGGAAAAEALAAAHAALAVRDKAAAAAAADAKELRLRAAEAVSKQREAEARLLDCMDQTLELEMRLIHYEQ